MNKKIILFILSITLLFSAIVTPVSAGKIDDFMVKVSDVITTAGESYVAVNITLENNPGIAGFSFCVNYDTDRLVLVDSKINIEGGYKVIAQPTGYGVNLAWTGATEYTKDGIIATLYFNVPKDVITSEACVDIVYREGYDSFYDYNENDILVHTVNGTVSIEGLKESTEPSLTIDGVTTNFGQTDIVVPIKLENNPGLSGFSFCVNYDTSRLVLENTEILIENGYKVIGYPEKYGVNIAWTSVESFTEDGTIAELHFSLKDDSDCGKIFINAVFRDGYDDFYVFADGTEQDISFDIYNGYVDVNNHTYGEWGITTDATCISTGLKVRTCSKCNKKESVVIPKVAHEYVSSIIKPTCTTKGYTKYTCKNCSYYYVDTYVDMVEHTLGDWQQSVAPQCEKKGEEIQKCTVCQTIINTREVAEKGHTYGEWYTVTPATFNLDGEERRDCQKCEHYETNILHKLSESHTCSFNGKEVIIEEPTSTKEGSKKVYCSQTECGKFTIVVIEATGNITEQLSITANTTSTSVNLKDKITLTSNATGGDGNYKYSFIVKNTNTGKWARLADKIELSSYTWTASSGGTREFYVEVTDGTGKTVRSSVLKVDVIVNDNMLATELKVSTTKVSVGDKVKFTATGTGGEDPYKYSYIVYNKTTKKWARLADKITSDTFTWKAGSAGTRLFYVDVTDASGKTVRSNAIIVVTEKQSTLSVNGQASATNVSTGENVKIKGTATGGEGPYKYSYIVYNKTTKKWARLADKITSDTFTWKAGSAGTRLFYVDVTDASGKTVRSNAIIVVTEKQSTLSVNGQASATNVSVGENVKITGTATGIDGPYTYSFVVYNKATNKWHRFDFSSSNILNWKATSEGTRIFYVEAKDENGEVVRSEAVTITVK